MYLNPHTRYTHDTCRIHRDTFEDTYLEPYLWPRLDARLGDALGDALGALAALGTLAGALAPLPPFFFLMPPARPPHVLSSPATASSSSLCAPLSLGSLSQLPPRPLLCLCPRLSPHAPCCLHPRLCCLSKLKHYTSKKSAMYIHVSYPITKGVQNATRGAGGCAQERSK